MKAIVLHDKAEASQMKLEEFPLPKIYDNEVLVKLKAASVNHLDVWVRMGQFPTKYPHIMGCEGAGEIADIGKNVKGLKKNDKVVVLPRIFCGKCEYCASGHDNLCKFGETIGVTLDGCYAEYVKAPARNVTLIGKLSYEEAASIPVAYGTAYRIIKTLAQLKPKETILITAAGSGVGTGAVQIAKHFGATVIAASGNDEKLQKAKKLGADFTINYSKNENFESEIKELTKGTEVDVVIEQVGGNIFTKSLGCLRRGGRIVVFGAIAGAVVQFNIPSFYRNNLTMIGSSGATKKEVMEIFELVKKGKVKSVIDRTFALEDASLAHKYMEERKNFGKIILNI